MAISQVASQNAGNTADNATSVTRAFPGNVTDGSRIIVAAGKYSPSNDAFVASDCAKSAGTATIGTVTLDNSRNYNFNGTEHIAVGVWSALVTGSGSLTMQVAGAVAGSYLFIAVDEYTSSLGAGSIIVDTGVTNSAEGTGSAPSSGSVTPSGLDALIVGILGSGTSAPTTHTPDAAFTTIFEEEDGSAHATGSAIRRIVTSSVTDAAEWALDATVFWAAAAAVYKEQMSASTPSTLPPTMTFVRRKQDQGARRPS